METLGPRLRAIRAAAGRTVASVAADAGLSVPYIANLENGRGNPTLAALERLARALGTGLTIDLGVAMPSTPAGPPPSLVRIARTDRFRRTAAALAAPDRDPGEVATALVDLLSRVGPTVGAEPADDDWWRILDALLLVRLHPAGTSERHGGGAPPSVP